MGWRDFKDDLLRVVVFALYPALELYGYFVFVGLFCLDDTRFDSWIVFILSFYITCSQHTKSYST